MTTPIKFFKQSILQLHPKLSEEAWHYLSAQCDSIQLPNKSIIIKEGILQKNLFFMTSGLVRGFYVNQKGDEITIRFINNMGWITHYAALISNTPSKYTFQALEQSEVIVLPYSTVLEGYDQYKGLEKFGRLIAESVLQSQQARIERFQFMNGEERYLDFIENNPALFNRFSISHLSTYLGIQRQSLTRIRKKLSAR